MSSQQKDSTSCLKWQQRHAQALRDTAESLQIGKDTAHTLSMQTEQLGCIERAVDETQATVDMSKRVLRGMTWSGWFYNKFAGFPQASSNQEPNKIVMGFICPECKVIFQSPEQLGMHYGSVHDKKESASATYDARRCNGQVLQDQSQLSGDSAEDIHDKFLLDLEPQLAELKQQSLAFGEALDMQNEQLERLDSKIGRVHHEMKKVGIEANKLVGTKDSAVVFRFRCAFQEIQTQKFLRDVDGEALLDADVVVDGCAFRAYTLGDDKGIWGFQSEKSNYFLGINRYGNLKIRGAHLNSYEQFLVECKPSTPFFSLSSYLGFGGWIARMKSKGGKNLTIIRGSPANKASAAYFKIINVDDGITISRKR